MRNKFCKKQCCTNRTRNDREYCNRHSNKHREYVERVTNKKGFINLRVKGEQLEIIDQAVKLYKIKNQGLVTPDMTEEIYDIYNQQFPKIDNVIKKIERTLQRHNSEYLFGIDERKKVINERAKKVIYKDVISAPVLEVDKQ